MRRSDSLICRVAAVVLACSGIGATGIAWAATVPVAVAANFTATLQRLATDFQHRSGHTLLISSGSSGKLTAQIQNGAPYAILLSADEVRPRQLAAAGLAVPGTQFTYAIGRLVLWSPQANTVDVQGAVLRTSFSRLAIANPKTAPYGTAAMQVLQRLGLWTQVQPRLVYGESIAQTLQFVSSGNVPLGFVALAQVVHAQPPGSRWRVPQTLYDPLRQDAVLLKRGATQKAAREFLAYLRSPAARALIAADGYGLPP